MAAEQATVPPTEIGVGGKQHKESAERTHSGTYAGANAHAQSHGNNAGGEAEGFGREFFIFINGLQFRFSVLKRRFVKLPHNSLH